MPPCAFAHKNDLSELLELKKENLEIKEKLAALENLLQGGKNSEKKNATEIFEEQIKEVELQLEKKNEQLKKLESDIEDLHLKFAEQKHTLNKVNKKLNVLKEKEVKIDILEGKINLIEKTSTKHIPDKIENDKAVTSKEDTSPENKCEQCDFVAKNDQGLKVHIKAKHTEKKI